MWFSRRRRRTRDELQFHRDRLTARYMSDGMDRKAAERRVFAAFGNLSVIEETSRDVRGRLVDDAVRDLGYALRTLRRNPGFAVISVMSLGLAIGANTAVFSLVNAVLVRPLPVHRPDELVQITRITPEGRPANVSYPLFEYLRDNLRSISGAFAHGTSTESILVDGAPEFVGADLVSGTYFDVLGVPASAGRLLHPDDDTPNASPVAVISDRYWTRRFARSPSAIGTTFRMRDRLFTIVGVTPPSFRSVRVGTSPDVIVPILLALTADQRREATSNFRLSPGASEAQASAEAQALWKAFIEPIAAGVPGGLRDEVQNRKVAALAAKGGLSPFRDQLSEPLVILMAIVGSILLLASVNLAGLLIARASAREREIAIRLAIGADRARLIRQFVTESAVLAALGGVIGLALARWLSSSLAALFINGRDLELSVSPDGHVLTFTAGIALATSCLAGLIPALQAFRVGVHPALKQVRVHGRGRLGALLVSTQLAISMALLVGAGFFIMSLVNLYNVDRGFDADGVLVVNVRTTEAVPAARAMAVTSALLERFKGTPGVRSASAAQVIPVSGNSWVRGIELADGAIRTGQATTAFNAVAPEYFKTMRTRLLQGREFDLHDTASSPTVAIVNDRFARDFFGRTSPIGRRVTSLNVAYEIVGVVADALYEDLRHGVEPTMYIPWTQRGDPRPTNYRYLVQSATGGPTNLSAALERAVVETDPALRVREIVPYSSIIDRSLPAERILATLGGVFGALAVVVAAVGMFALLAFQVARRTNELGVRMALGATRSSMVSLVLKDVAWMLVPGVILGGLAALMLAGVVRGLFFGLTPTDARVYALAAGVLTSAAVAAAWVPAWRAARVDPLTALRQD